MSNETIAEKLLKRASVQPSSVREEGIFVIYDETILPAMQMAADWETSGTKQWSRRELNLLKTYDGEQLAEALTSDPWIFMAGVSELLMHGEEAKAKVVARSAVRRDPNHMQTLNHYFGEEITQDLLK